jgi:hypothetical protein
MLWGPMKSKKIKSGTRRCFLTLVDIVRYLGFTFTPTSHPNEVRTSTSSYPLSFSREYIFFSKFLGLKINKIKIKRCKTSNLHKIFIL